MSDSDSGSDTASVSPSTAPLNSPPHLPIEVCERIIEFIPDLHYYDWDEPGSLQGTLFACCLTCRDWFPRSRLLLYHRVMLDHPEAYTNNIPHFILGLKCNPANGLLVHTLRVHFEDVPSSTTSLLGIILPHLLPNLQFILCLGADLINIHPRFYTGLSHFRTVCSLHLQKPEISTYDQLFRFIAAFPKLTRLYIEGISSNHISEGRSPTSNRKLAIPHLNLWISLRFLSTIINWFSPCVTSLEVTLALRSSDNLDDSIRATMGFVQSCGASLCHLKITWDALEGVDDFGLLDFSHNTSLRTLQLVNICVDEVEDMHAIGRMLTTVSSSCLDELVMELEIHGDVSEISLAG